MRSYPTEEWELKDSKRLGPEPWMLDLLKLNPDYTCWGPYEDYMWVRGRDEPPDDLGRKGEGGWNSRVLIPTWKEFYNGGDGWHLDDYNECVNFYFEVSRQSARCEVCEGNGMHPDAQWVSESFYSHSSPFKHQNTRELQAAIVMASFSGSLPKSLHGHGSYPTEETFSKYSPDFRAFCESMRGGDGHWSEDLTEDEYQALRDAGRTWDGPIGHDAINRSILVDQRCKRFGIPTQCPRCEGHGDVFTSNSCHVGLILWWLHPRKGCSRGIEIQRVEQSEVGEVLKFLSAAAQRNADRFAKVIAESSSNP